LDGNNIALINAIFSLIAEEFDNINIIYQILSVILVQSQKPKKGEISDFEKQLAFPEYEGIERITAQEMLDDRFKAYLTAAVKRRELPPSVNIEDITISLMTIITGTIFAVKFGDVKSRGYHYRRQLQVLWKSLGVKALDKKGR
jgi:hypothetical protein